MFVLVQLGFFVLAILALRGKRWAYVAFVVLGLLFFPARVGFQLQPQACELALTVPLAVFSLTNYAHIVTFAWFYVVTCGMLTRGRFRIENVATYVWAGLATLTMGALVEIAEGVSGRGHCRVRDLVPDAAGALLGAAIVFLCDWLLRRRALVRSAQAATST